jgi:hypothetical protein
MNNNGRNFNYFDCLDAIYLYECGLKKKGWDNEAINKEILKQFREELEYCLGYAKLHDIKSIIKDYKKYNLE